MPTPANGHITLNIHELGSSDDEAIRILEPVGRTEKYYFKSCLIHDRTFEH
jgi:hypothetical protein